jgi:hypothetical protein
MDGTYECKFRVKVGRAGRFARFEPDGFPESPAVFAGSTIFAGGFPIVKKYRFDSNRIDKTISDSVNDVF